MGREIHVLWKEMKVPRNRLVWEACLSSGVMVTSSPWLLPGAMPGSMTLVQIGSVLMSVAHVTTEGYEDPEVWVATYGHTGASGPCHHKSECPGLPPRAMERSRLELWPQGNVWVFDPIATRVCVDIQGSCCH